MISLPNSKDIIFIQTNKITYHLKKILFTNRLQLLRRQNQDSAQRFVKNHK